MSVSGFARVPHRAMHLPPFLVGRELSLGSLPRETAPDSQAGPGLGCFSTCPSGSGALGTLRSLYPWHLCTLGLYYKAWPSQQSGDLDSDCHRSKH